MPGDPERLWVRRQGEVVAAESRLEPQQRAVFHLQKVAPDDDPTDETAPLDREVVQPDFPRIHR